MKKARIFSVIILIIAIFLGWYSVQGGFRLGLDLAGGTHLSYKADTSELDPVQVTEAMDALRDLIETRTNLFGVGEPVVQVEKGGFLSDTKEDRLIVELPGVTDIEEAINIIGKTPDLEFRLVPPDLSLESGETLAYEDTIPTGLTGKFLEPNGSSLQFEQGNVGGASGVYILVRFNEEGGNLFSEITGANIGRQLAIYLDGNLESAPVIQDKIDGGVASITGSFTLDEAKSLVRDLNFGALPIPIELIGTQSIGPSLGVEVLESGKTAGLIGITIVILFLIFWYRLPGVMASISLVIYVILMLAIFKSLSITLTAAGIAGFIMSIGMAVDANILIFERMKEELIAGRNLEDAIKEGFSRAWLSIRDANISSIITAVVLFYLSTSLVKGFALVFGVGVLVSMITAISISRTMLLAISHVQNKSLYKIGFGKN